MRRLSSFVLILIAFALLGQIAVASFAPNLTKFTTASTANPSGWNEETAEEDESGEEDKVANGAPAWLGYETDLRLTSVDHTCELRDPTSEILVPPPQA